MAKRLITRRQIAVLAAGLVGAGLSGCGAVAPAAKVVIEALKRVPWDKVSTIVVNLITGTAALIGIVDGKEVKAEVSLTPEEIEKIKKGESVEVEVKNGSKETIKPEIKGK